MIYQPMSHHRRFPPDGRAPLAPHMTLSTPSGSSKNKKSCAQGVTSNFLSVSSHFVIYLSTGEPLHPSISDGGAEWLRREDVCPYLQTLLVLD